MSVRWTEQDLAEAQQRLSRAVPKGRDTPGGHDGQPRPNSADANNARAAATAVNSGPAGGNVIVSGDAREARQPNKYGAIKTVAPASWGGQRLADSKAGAALCQALDTLKSVGTIIDWFEEVSLPIGVDERGKVIRYRADAMVVLGYVDAQDGSDEPALVVRFIDRKRDNMDTPTSKAKRAALRARGLNVEVRQ